MGNKLLVQNITSNLVAEIDITQHRRRSNDGTEENEEVTFLNGMLQGITTFKRHNFQYYKVHTGDQVFALRIIQTLNEPRSIATVERMQTKLLNIRHPNLA